MKRRSSSIFIELHTNKVNRINLIRIIRLILWRNIYGEYKKDYKIKNCHNFIFIFIFIYAAWNYPGRNSHETMEIFDGHGSIMLMIDQNTGEIIYGNQAAHDFYRYPGEELLNQNINEINQLSEEEVASEMAAAAREERNYFHFEHRLADGQIRHVEVYSYPQTFQDREILFSIFNDVTERVQLAARNQAINRNFYIALGVIILTLLIFSSLLYRNYKKLQARKDEIDNFNKLRQTFIDADDSLIYLKDNDLKYIFVNQKTADFYGLKKEEIIGKDDYQISNEEFASLKERTDRTALDRMERVVEEVQVDGRIYYSNKFPVELIDGSYGVGAYIKDVTEDYRQKSRLAVERNKYLQTILSIGDGVIVINNKQEIEMINKVAQELTGWDYKEAKGKNYREILNWRLADKNGKGSGKDLSSGKKRELEDPIEQAFATESIQELQENLILISRDGSRYYLEDSAAPIKDDNGKTRGVVFVFRDATEQKKHQEEIEQLSYHDHLTGLYNRRFFKEELKRLDVPRNLPISIIIGDLNGLKLTNDIFGHSAGDKLIIKAAETFREVCRKDDIIARWGGDEFIILLPETPKSAALSIIERIKTSYSNKNFKALTARISLGAGTKEKKEQDINKILDRAEKSMYSTKAVNKEEENIGQIESVIKNLYNKSPAEKRHAIRVKDLALKFASYLNLEDSLIQKIGEVAFYHDIGKVGIDPEILNKEGRLTYEEFKEMKLHPVIGYRILNYFKDTVSIASYVLYHHENWDGTGYPKNLAGEKIPLGSRVIKLVETYDIMTSEYSYKKPVSSKEALDEIREYAGSQFDPELADRFIDFIEELREIEEDKNESD